DRWTAQSDQAPFYRNPQAIAKTLLVAVSWPERGNVLFPDGKFDWDQVEQALDKEQWEDIGGDPSWGSFDVVITDPARSNSGQLALSLWSQSKVGGRSLTPSHLGTSEISDLFSLVKRSVYQPPRSTDILLQEFITRGPNEADIAFVYESIALHRWQQSSLTQSNPYQVYYLEPTIETVATAAIVTRNVNQSTADAAQQFLNFLAEPEQQSVFVQFGFRSANSNVDIQSVVNSPWLQSIPGVSASPPPASPTPEQTTLAEVIRLWQRAQ
ncbi:MAG: ABC transporter substrate-binding protein, partial [Symploca sp. SIO2B6]|nr:ABC transporter substrate-binding protein [Symploca sp. SIO2B6]